MHQQEELAGVRDVLDVVPYVALIVDERGQIIYANPRSRRIFRASPEELVGRSVHDLLPEGLRPWPPGRQDRPVTRPLDRPLGEGLTVPAVRDDGTTFQADVLLSPVPTPTGPYRTVILKDVALRQELLCGEEHLALSQRVAGMGSWEHDLISGEVQFSRQFYRLLDLDPGSGPVGAGTFFDRVHPEDLPLLLAEVERASVEGGAFSATVRLVSRAAPTGRPGADDGVLRVVRSVAVRGTVDLDHQGRAVRTFGTVQDVSAQAALEGALRASELRFRAAFDQAPTGMALIDARQGPHAVLIMVNDALCRLSGRSATDLIEGTLLDLFDPGDRASAQGHVQALLEGELGPDEAMDLRLGPAGTPERWVSVSGALVRDHEGRPDYVVAHFVDVTARRREEAATWEHAERDRRIATILQKTLAPSVPCQLGPARIACRYRPAGQGEHVGGDWVDAFLLPDARLGIVIGDVAGHGVEAAATMTRLRTIVHLLASSGVSPAGVMRRLNDSLHETDLGGEIQLATMVHGQLDLRTGVMLYSSAGHLPMLTLAPRPGTGRAIASPVPAIGGPPIGVIPGYTYSEQAVVVEPAGFLIGFTDGLIERRGRGLDASLLDLLSGLNDLPVATGGVSAGAGECADVEAVADAVIATSPGPADDDTAVLVLAYDVARLSPMGVHPGRDPRRHLPQNLDDVAVPPDRWA